MENKQWESIDANYTYRLKIPNGWLVRYGGVINGVVSMCEIYDPNHYWDMTDEEIKLAELEEQEAYIKSITKENEERMVLEEPDFDIEAPE